MTDPHIPRRNFLSATAAGLATTAIAAQGTGTTPDFPATVNRHNRARFRLESSRRPTDWRPHGKHMN